MQLVGAYQILRPLADLALYGGQQLGGDRCCQDILQHVVEGFILLRVVPGQVTHQIPHQGLGNGAVDRVHAHMVAVIRAPAQGQFAQVSRADDKSAAAVGDIHQHLGPLPGLGVFKGDGVIVHIVADVLKVAADAGGDIHGFQHRPHPLRQDHGIVPGPVRGAKAGHRDGNDVRHGPVQHFHGKARHQHRQRGVQSAGEPHHSGLGPGVPQPLL